MMAKTKAMAKMAWRINENGEIMKKEKLNGEEIVKGGEIWREEWHRSGVIENEENRKRQRNNVKEIMAKAAQ
jgi:hypothetical protein